MGEVCLRGQTQPEKICKSQCTNQCHSLRTLWFVLCNLQIFSVVFVTSNELHAQSPFLFPILLSINLTLFSIFARNLLFRLLSPGLFGYVLLYLGHCAVATLLIGPCHGNQHDMCQRALKMSQRWCLETRTPTSSPARPQAAALVLPSQPASRRQVHCSLILGGRTSTLGAWRVAFRLKTRSVECAMRGHTVGGHAHVVDGYSTEAGTGDCPWVWRTGLMRCGRFFPRQLEHRENGRTGHTRWWTIWTDGEN